MKVRPRKGGPETEAVQWFPNVEVEGIELVPVMIRYDADGSRYRIEGDGVQTTMWLDLDGQRAFLDEFWTVPPGRNPPAPISLHDSLYLQFAKRHGWQQDAREYGRLPTGDRVHTAEWLVRTVLGAWTIYNPADFKQMFEVMP
jgi:hypothetical protein